MSEIDRSAVEKANRLYWESDASVADIAEQMGWSRRALYDAVEPLPTERPCSTCGTPLVYANRSARTAGTLTCVACAERAAERESELTARDDARLERALSVEARDRREQGYAIGGAVVVGAVVAAAATLLLVRRD
jgi:hypothetical protein